MIASDIHGSEYYCSKLLKAFDREEADRAFAPGRYSIPMAPEMTFLKVMTQNSLSLCLTACQKICCAFGEIVTPKLTKWF